MSAASKHPELLLGPNPFFESLRPFLPFEDIADALERMPLAAIDLRSVEFSRREALIETIENHFVATRENFEICSGIQILIRGALALRNPAERQERKRLNQVGSVENVDALQRIPTLAGAGMLIEGITGMGKSAVIHRILEVLVPEQVVTYGSDQSCGWHRLTQCYYLFIDHPSNGTRGALLKRILMELDTQVGTSYFDHHQKTANLDTLLVVVCKLLSAHRVALLIIDENQQSNLADSPWSTEFVLFYHHLLNLGISVLLSGSLMAFDHLKSMAQVMRRFSKGGVHSLTPAQPAAKWWIDDFIPGIRSFDLVENWDLPHEWRADFEFKYTAGLPGAYVALHKEVMRSALRRSTAFCVVSEEDFQVAIASPRYRDILRIVSTIHGDNPTTSGAYSDIPAQVSNPAQSADASASELQSSAVERSNGIEYLKRRLARVQAHQTKEINALKKSIQLARALSPEDVRMQGISEELINSMEEELARRTVANDGGAIARAKADT